MPMNQPKYWRAMFRHIPNSPNDFSIGAHGNLNGVVNKLGRTLTPQQLLSIMYDAGYDDEQPVKIYACDTGKGGTDSFAQKLSNLIGQPVTAPTNLLLIGGNGGHSIANGGAWVTFTPQSRGD